MTTKYNKGWENLRSLADVSPEERHSIQSSGGKASAAAKKERRRLEDLTHQILSKQLSHLRQRHRQSPLHPVRAEEDP